MKIKPRRRQKILDTLFGLTLAALAITALAVLVASGAEIRLTEDDGTVRVFVEKAPLPAEPTTQPVETTTPPVVGPVVPTEPPPPVAPPATMKLIRVRPEFIAQDLAGVRDDTRVVFNRGATYILPATWRIGHDRVSVASEGPGARPILKANGSLRVAIAIAGSADKTTIEDIAFGSDDAWGEGPVAVEISGSNATVRRSNAENVYQFFNFTDGSSGALIDGCENVTPASVHFYWAYVKGKNHRFINCTMRRPVVAALRCNKLDGWIVEGGAIIGGRKDGKSSADSASSEGRVTLQDCRNVTFKSVRFERNELGTGPLWNIDGFNQTPEATWLAMRSANIRMDGCTVIDGMVKIGKGTDGFVMADTQMTPPPGKVAIKIDGGQTVTFGGRTFNLPGPVNITIDGRKLR